MIFLTVGTQLPFDRLTLAVDSWAERNRNVEIIGQIGLSNCRPKNILAYQFISANEIELKINIAELIVAHAGIGTIVNSLSAGKPLIIFPRKRELCEHRNNHQISTARYFNNKTGIYVAYNEEQLHYYLDHRNDLKAGKKIKPYAPEKFLNEIRLIIDK